MDSRIRALYKIAAEPEGPAQARRIIAEELSARLSSKELDDVKLMVSELVTNGIVHGHPEDDIPVMLDLCVNGDIRCAVLDQGPGFAARAEPSADGRERDRCDRAMVRRLDPDGDRFRSLHEACLAQIVAATPGDGDLCQRG